MKEQLISFECAKLAKEKGFDIPQNKMYSFGYEMFTYIPIIKFHDGDKYECSSIPYNWNDGKSPTKIIYCSAPTQSLLQRWLREVHNIYIYSMPINESTENIRWYNNISIRNNIYYTTYEEALEAGLIEGLKLIK